MLTVQTIVSIAAQAERVFDHRYHFDLLMEQSLYAGDMGASPTGVRRALMHLWSGATKTPACECMLHSRGRGGSSVDVLSRLIGTIGLFPMLPLLKHALSHAMSVRSAVH